MKRTTRVYYLFNVDEIKKKLMIPNDAEITVRTDKGGRLESLEACHVKIEEGSA